MKRLLIAVGMAAMLMGAAPAMASPAAPAPGIAAPQDMRDGGRDDRRMDRRDDRRADRRADRRNDRRWGNNGRHNPWGNNRYCHNVRRHHRWVRVCGRR